MSTDVLGRVVEVASGRSLADFFRTRIFEPLGMTDTGFFVSPENTDRLVSLYRLTENGLVGGSGYEGDFTRRPSWDSGGGGLTSTAMDYLRFAQMLVQEGELDGARILRPETVREMTRNQLGDLGTISLAPTDGFGLGFAVSVTGPTPGIYWWVGVVNTWFWIDPVERIVAFAWTQLDPLGAARINPLMRRLVYDAVVDSRRAVPAGAP
jgi:CubicO group peptidase (beta-lactamase class C family)